MTAHKRISRAEERVFTASREEAAGRPGLLNTPNGMREREQEEFNPRNRTRRGFN